MARSESPVPADPDDPQGWTRAQVGALAAVTLLATALRLFRIEQWSWSSGEATAWRAITQPLAGPDGLFASREGWAPLGYLGVRWLCDLGVLPSHGEGWLRLPFGFAGVVAVPLLALVGRPLVGAGAALLAALLLAIHPLHVAVSQSMEPVGFALPLALLGLACVQQGARAAAVAAMALAGLCAGIGWIGLVLLVAGRLPSRLRERAERGVAWLALPACASGLGALTLPVVAAAAVGWCFSPTASLRAATAWSLGVGAASSLAAGPEGQVLLVSCLPGVLLLAAVGLQRVFTAARATLGGSPRVVAAGAALPAAVVVTWLGVGVFLHAMVYRGGRSPWRTAAEAVWVAASDRGSFVVGAAAGVPSLTCYLRPNHWRGPGADPHPGTVVLSLDLTAPAAAIARLAARDEVLVLLVLREDEVGRFGPVDRARLDATFELLRVVQSPQAHGDDTLYVFRRSTAR